MQKKIREAVMGSKIGEAFHSIAFRYFLRKSIPKSHCGKHSYILTPSWVNKGGGGNIYMGDYCHIDTDNVLYCTGGRLIFKDRSVTSVGFTAITGNHQRVKGKFFLDTAATHNIEKDIIVEEDVWIGANVTLLGGAVIGRGATIGAGTVCSKSVPPYAIVMGNPAKVVGFNFRPEEIIEHEKKLYPEEQRLSFELLEKNYDKFFLQRLKEIKELSKL